MSPQQKLQTCYTENWFCFFLFEPGSNGNLGSSAGLLIIVPYHPLLFSVDFLLLVSNKLIVHLKMPNPSSIDVLLLHYNISHKIYILVKYECMKFICTFIIMLLSN